jgi:diacylglycerol kinase (ATP)
LPLGTANNIANTLGVAGTPLEVLIQGWKTARSVNFDAAVAKGPWESQNFVEGFGVGLFAETMSQIHEQSIELPSADNPKKEIPAIVKILNDQLKNFPAKHMSVQLDGKDVSGNYILLEALNTRYIGPNLDLVPRAEINDGFLDIVFVAKGERAKLSKYISDRIKRKKSRANLTIRRGQHLQIEWQNSPIHIDDMTWPTGKDRTPLRSNAIDIQVDPAALVFLIPRDKKRRRPRSRA